MYIRTAILFAEVRKAGYRDYQDYPTQPPVSASPRKQYAISQFLDLVLEGTRFEVDPPGRVHRYLDV